jgi:hypothetical protein
MNFISPNDSTLIHVGVLGMKWGRRKGSSTSPLSGRITRGHAGPSVGLTKKHQEEFANRDLKTLNNGGHLSVGVTKKRQESFDKRDKELVKKNIQKLIDAKKNEKLSNLDMNQMEMLRIQNEMFRIQSEASRRITSLGLTGGTNPFMFG